MKITYKPLTAFGVLLLTLGCASNNRGPVPLTGPQACTKLGSSNVDEIKEVRIGVARNSIAYVSHLCKGKKVHDVNSACPSLANPYCKVNWSAISLGMSTDEVTALLGTPKSVLGTLWQYDLPNANVYVTDGKVSGFAKPNNDNYLYLGSLITPL